MKHGSLIECMESNTFSFILESKLQKSPATYALHLSYVRQHCSFPTQTPAHTNTPSSPADCFQLTLVSSAAGIDPSAIKRTGEETTPHDEGKSREAGTIYPIWMVRFQLTFPQKGYFSMAIKEQLQNSAILNLKVSLIIVVVNILSLFVSI